MQNLNRPQLPTSLTVVAVLFIIGGAFAALGMVGHLFRGQLNLNFAVLGLFIGPGLLRLSRGWRTCGLVLIWIGLIVAPIVALMALVSGPPPTFKVLGTPVAHVPRILAFAVAAGFFALAYWQYTVLTRSDVRRLFGLPGA